MIGLPMIVQGSSSPGNFSQNFPVNSPTPEVSLSQMQRLQGHFPCPEHNLSLNFPIH